MAIAAKRRNPRARNISTDLRMPFAGSLPTQQPRETRSNGPSCLTVKTYRVTSTLSKTVRTSFTFSQITTKSFWSWKVSVAFESVMRQGESKPVISCLSLEIQFTGLSWTADVLPCCPSSHRFSTERKRISGGRGTHSYDGHARDHLVRGEARYRR